MDDPNDQTKADEKQLDSQPNQSQDDTMSPEELEWTKLKGNTQARFRTLLRERNELRRQVEDTSTQQPVYQPPPPPTMQPQYPVTQQGMTEQQLEAVNRLRNKYGFITQEDLDKMRLEDRESYKNLVQEIRDDIILDNEYQRLEQGYNGNDGRPAFDRTEIEDHMKRTGIYNPEKAYLDLYAEELFDWKVEKMGGKTEEKPDQPYTAKPTSATATKTEPMSIDSIRERIRQPDGREWYEKNRDKLLPQLASLMPQE